VTHPATSGWCLGPGITLAAAAWAHAGLGITVRAHRTRPVFCRWRSIDGDGSLPVDGFPAGRDGPTKRLRRASAFARTAMIRFDLSRRDEQGARVFNTPIPEVWCGGQLGPTPLEFRQARKSRSGAACSGNERRIADVKRGFRHTGALPPMGRRFAHACQVGR
jgi:hypothetical protein